jgi:hypothetical protein
MVDDSGNADSQEPHWLDAGGSCHWLILVTAGDLTPWLSFPHSFFSLSRNRCQPVSTASLLMILSPFAQAALAQGQPLKPVCAIFTDAAEDTVGSSLIEGSGSM